MTKHTSIKHGTADYRRVHDWMRYRYKKTKCEYPNCKGNYKRLEWALIKGKQYETRRENFMILCSTCHKTYDGIAEINRKAMLGRKFSKETRKKISKYWLGRPHFSLRKKVIGVKDGVVYKFGSVTEAAEATKCKRNAISAVLNGRAHTSNGYVWTYNTEENE